MKQFLLIVVALGIALGTWMYFGDSADQSSMSSDGSSASSTSSIAGGDNGLGGGGNFSDNGSPTGGGDLDDDEDYDEEYDDRPAAEIYKTADEALEAVKKGALDYDDIILEQFVEPGEDCTWCDQFYAQVTNLMKQEGASEDEHAYYSELLAISGRVENIKTLIDSITDSTDEDAADIFAESLELTIGGDDVVEYLTGYIEDDNELLQEASVAAITNQGSKLAAETLYDHTVKSGDPDGYYDIGIGLGEFFPEEEALPYIQEKVLQRDQYSHLAVKSLLNYGYDGLVLVFDALTNSSNPEFDETMLTDALDHVGYEEETEDFLKKTLEGDPSPVAKKFAEEILEGFELEEQLDDEEDEDEIE